MDIYNPFLFVQQNCKISNKHLPASLASVILTSLGKKNLTQVEKLKNKI